MRSIKKFAVAGVTAALAAGLTVVALAGSTATAVDPVSQDGGIVTCRTNATGHCTVPHGLGRAPAVVQLTEIYYPATTAYNVVESAGGRTASSVRVKAVWNTGGVVANANIEFNLWVGAGPVVPPPTTTQPPTQTTPSTTAPTTTTDSGTSTPTSTTTSTTTTTTSPPAGRCTNPSFTTTSSDNNGDGRTFGPYFVHNNMWNNHSGSGPPGTYTMGVCDYDSWFELVTQQPSTVSPGAVRAYPNVHKDYNDIALSRIQSADFAATSPRCAGCVYNVAFDVWINDGFTNELMIWTENFGQRPAGSRLADADQNPANGTSNLMSIGGKTYQVWKSGGLTSSGGIFTYVADPVQLSGNMPLNLFFADLQRRGWIPPNSTTWQVDFGVETVSTAGTQQRFDFTDFEIHETAS